MRIYLNLIVFFRILIVARLRCASISVVGSEGAEYTNGEIALNMQNLQETCTCNLTKELCENVYFITAQFPETKGSSSVSKNFLEVLAAFLYIAPVLKLEND